MKGKQHMFKEPLKKFKAHHINLSGSFFLKRKLYQLRPKQLRQRLETHANYKCFTRLVKRVKK